MTNYTQSNTQVSFGGSAYAASDVFIFPQSSKYTAAKISVRTTTATSAYTGLNTYVVKAPAPQYTALSIRVIPALAYSTTAFLGIFKKSVASAKANTRVTSAPVYVTGLSNTRVVARKYEEAHTSTNILVLNKSRSKYSKVSTLVIPTGRIYNPITDSYYEPDV
jgi:hypothetical protein